MVNYTCTGTTGAVLQLKDITGRVLSTSLLPQAGITTIDVSKLPTGTYIYTILEGNTIKLAGKLSKN